MAMAIGEQTSNTRTDSERIKSIIEARLIQAPPDVKATFPPVLKQGKVLSAVVYEPEYLIVAFLTTEEENRFNEYISRQLNPLVELITTGPEKAEFRAERVRYATARSCTVVNSFSFSLGLDSTILLEDLHQIIEAANIGTISYTVPLA